jgi:6-phosphogluconolactonase (cycloisomerase 2 family)
MHLLSRHIARVSTLTVALVAVTACGGESSTPPSGGGTGPGGTGSAPPPPPPPPPFVGYTVSGTTSGLVGQGLVLKLYGLNYVRPQSLDQLPISSNGHYDFTTNIGTNGPNASVAGSFYPATFHYGVVIGLQPHSPTQRCVVSDSYWDFTITANVTDVGVVCGEFSYSTNTADNAISGFSVDAYTGALVSVGPPVAAGRSPYALVSSGDKQHLYVANSDSNDVSALAVDQNSGQLTTVPGSPFAAGTRPRAVALFRSTLFVANAGSDNLSVYRVDPKSGVPTPRSPASYATGTGPSVMAIKPGNGPYGFPPILYIANAGSNDISAFWILGAYGPEQALESVGSPFRSGSSVTSLAFGAAAVYAANANGVDATISGFSIDPNTAALTSLPGFPFALPSCNYIAADRTDTYLYATAGTNVLGYSIDAQTGALSPLPGFPVAVGANADSISIDPTNQFLYVRNGSAGTVIGFELNAATGELTLMPGSPFAVGKSADFFATF